MKKNTLSPLHVLLFSLILIFQFSCSKDSDLMTDYVLSETQEALDIKQFVVDDTFFIASNGSITLDVLANDAFENPEEVVITETSAPANGTVELNNDNTLTYTPETTEETVDTFTYTTEMVNSDETVSSETGNVTVNVNIPSASREFEIPPNAKVATGESYGMVANNAGVNNHAAMKSALDAHRAGNLDVLTLTGGAYYNFDTTIGFWENVDGFTLTTTGTGRATLTINEHEQLWRETQAFTNANFINIKFESTATSNLGQDSEAAVMFFYNATQSNILIDNCEFTAPNGANSNGLKFFANDASPITNVTVKNSYFHDTGRMGAETVTGISSGRPMNNFLWEYNTFENTGQVSDRGMGVSIDGWSQFHTVRYNTFHNNPNTAIELIGLYNGEIHDNVMTGTGSAVHVVTGSGVLNKDINIYNNVADVGDGNVYINGENITHTNNSWKANQRFYGENLNNVTFNNDTFEVRGYNDKYASPTPTFQNAATGAIFILNNCIVKQINSVALSTSGITLNCTDVYNQNGDIIAEYANSGEACGAKGATID